MLTALKFIPCKAKTQVTLVWTINYRQNNHLQTAHLYVLVTIVTLWRKPLHRHAMFPVIAGTFASHAFCGFDSAGK